MPCTVCGQKGCDECGQRGYTELDKCPLEILKASDFEFLRIVKMFEKGILPEPGGLLDQTQAFLTAAEFVMDEMDYYKQIAAGKNPIMGLMALMS